MQDFERVTVCHFNPISPFVSDEVRVSMVSSPKTKTETETWGFQDQDQDQDSEVPRARPRPRPRPRLWGSRPRRKTETKTCKNGSRDVWRTRLKSRELQSAKLRNESPATKVWCVMSCLLSYYTLELSCKSISLIFASTRSYLLCQLSYKLVGIEY